MLSRSLVGINVRQFFDNFFTSPSLIYKLEKEQIYACGSVRQNRNGLPKHLKNNKDMKRDLDERHADGIQPVKRMDMKSETVLLTIDSSTVCQQCR